MAKIEVPVICLNIEGKTSATAEAKDHGDTQNAIIVDMLVDGIYNESEVQNAIMEACQTTDNDTACFLTLGAAKCLHAQLGREIEILSESEIEEVTETLTEEALAALNANGPDACEVCGDTDLMPTGPGIWNCGECHTDNYSTNFTDERE